MSDNPISINIYNELPADMTHPCDEGLHLWEWFQVTGARKCYRCGVMR